MKKMTFDLPDNRDGRKCRVSFDSIEDSSKHVKMLISIESLHAELARESNKGWFGNTFSISMSRNNLINLQRLWIDIGS